MAKDTEHKDAPSERREFIQRAVLTSLAATGLSAAAAQSDAEAQSCPDEIKPVLELTFDRRRPPKLDELVQVIEKVSGVYGCTECGFGGFDIRVRLASLINPDPAGWAAELNARRFG